MLSGLGLMISPAVRGAGVLLLSLPALAAPPVFLLENEHLQFGLSQNDGRLVQFTDRNSNWNHVADQASSLGLWKLELRRNGKDVELSPAQAKTFGAERVRGSDGIRLSWRDFQVEGLNELEVVVDARLELGQALSKWTIAVHNQPDTVLEKVHFPQFPAIRPQPDEYLAVPVWMGQLAADPRALLRTEAGKEKRLEWDYPGLTSLQCLAFYRKNGPGLYFSCDDTASFRKSFVLSDSGDGQVHFVMVHLPENRESATYRLPYQAIIGAFQGDWFTAAAQYRSWATNQAWARDSRRASRLTPDWVTETGMWVWNRGRSSNVLAPAIALEKELGLPVRVFWHWWHGCAYDTGFPEYLPPREGVESFTNALTQAHRNSVRAIVYMNQRLWGMTTESWQREKAERYAVKAGDGTVRPETYNTFTKLPCASMCMGTPFWRDKYAGLAEEVFLKLGVDGIYMDQACSSLACYDAAHGHPVGGGRYWVDGFRLLAGDIRLRCAGQRQIALAGEGCGEGWLPFLDLMLSLQVSEERYADPRDGWQPIPFFQAVYHPYCVLYGNYSSLTMPPYDDLWPKEFAPAEPLKLLDRRYSQQFLLEQARAFVWGQQPSVANFFPAQLKERNEETEFMMQLAKLRIRALKYLQHGTFLRPPELNAPEATLSMSRLSIYAGQQGALKSFQRRYPLVLGGAWRAPDGHVGLALVSIAAEPQTVSTILKAPDYGLPREGSLYRLTSSERRRIGRFEGTHVSLSVPLAPREACVVELGP
jgi:hypothetical protein